MDRKSLGRRINATRKSQHVTSEKLSELCNINATYLRQIEGGTKTPSLPVFVLLCQQLSVSPSFLLADDLHNHGIQDIEQVAELLNSATPEQISLIVAMITSALNVLKSNNLD